MPPRLSRPGRSCAPLARTRPDVVTTTNSARCRSAMSRTARRAIDPERSLGIDIVVLFRSSAGSVEDIVGGGIQLAGIVFDAKWRNGDWPIVTNRPPVKVRSPWFVVGHEGLGNLRLENFDGSVTHVATPTEAAKHRYRTISSPMALQWAAEAKHGRREWNKDLDCFRDLAVELSSG